jgi:hypothetical protein
MAAVPRLAAAQALRWEHQKHLRTHSKAWQAENALSRNQTGSPSVDLFATDVTLIGWLTGDASHCHSAS